MTPTRSLAIALAAVCAATLAGCGKQQPPEPLPEATNSYVALGDSFTAVAGTGRFTNAMCRRSKDDYPTLVAKQRHLRSFEDASCGGAAPEDLAGSQKIENLGVNQPQLNAVSADTKLITVGIGLNETINGSPIAYVLTELCETKTRKGDACQAYLRASDADWSKVIDALGEKVAAALDLVKQRAPDARVVFVGYPRVLPDTGTCAAVPLPAVAVERLRTTMRLTNETLKQVASAAKVEYVDMYTASEGHDVCSADPWVNGYKERKGKAFAFHPFQSYHQAVADRIVALLKTKKPQA